MAGLTAGRSVSAMRPAGWRIRRRPTSKPTDDWIERQARQFAAALRVRLTQACEAVLRQVYPDAAAAVRQAAVTIDMRQSEARQVCAHLLDTELHDLIKTAAEATGQPRDSLDVDVLSSELAPFVTVEFKMPEHSDQAHLQRVLAELAAQHGGRAT